MQYRVTFLFLLGERGDEGTVTDVVARVMTSRHTLFINVSWIELELSHQHPSKWCVLKSENAKCPQYKKMSFYFNFQEKIVLHMYTSQALLANRRKQLPLVF